MKFDSCQNLNYKQRKNHDISTYTTPFVFENIGYVQTKKNNTLSMISNEEDQIRQLSANEKIKRFEIQQLNSKLHSMREQAEDELKALESCRDQQQSFLEYLQQREQIMNDLETKMQQEISDSKKRIDEKILEQSEEEEQRKLKSALKKNQKFKLADDSDDDWHLLQQAQQNLLLSKSRDRLGKIKFSKVRFTEKYQNDENFDRYYSSLLERK